MILFFCSVKKKHLFHSNGCCQNKNYFRLKTNKQTKNYKILCDKSMYKTRKDNSWIYVLMNLLNMCILLDSFTGGSIV